MLKVVFCEYLGPPHGGDKNTTSALKVGANT